MAGSDPFHGVSAHYGLVDLTAPILDALRSQGKDLDALTADDLAPLTHLTGRPKAATVELGRLAALQPGMHVLDLGSGLGGPARTLATEFGCRVSGVDLTESFVRTATTLTNRVGLGGQVTFQYANALEMPFDDASFDVVWHEQFAMHVPDKERLYREIWRVLKPGGRLAMREFLAGPVQPLHYPVPWTADGAISFLGTAEALRDLLGRVGFRELAWEDLTASDLERRRALAASGGGAPAALTGGQLFQQARGDDFQQVQANLGRNYAEGRLQIVQAVFQRD
ncbi:MAG TPA: methyltransferase domain-containing protein [Chloroflexota bacterium]|nr:methyltransferase domain-containing protein [Chloroflexota bacterium]